MIPRLKPTLGWSELATILSPAGSDGVERFETAFAELMGQTHAIAFPYGRTGLMLLLQAMGWRDREIICPAYTCVVVPHAIVSSGNEPVFIDSCEYDFNMDLDQAEAAITDRTAAIVATSIFGYPVDLDKLAAIRKKHPHIEIIQDCAHSYAAEWQGRPVQREGLAAIFGINISKIMTSIFGGMVTTDDDALNERLRALRDESLEPATFMKSLRRRLYLAAAYPAFWGPVYGLVNLLERSAFLNRFVKYYDEAIIDMPLDHLTEMAAIEAAVGCVQVRRYSGIVAHRQATAAYYDDQLQGLPDFVLPPIVDGATYSHYVPRVSDRDALLASGLLRGVQFGQLIEYCVPEMKAYAERPGARFPCPFASRLAATTINLPLSIPPVKAARVAEVIKRSRCERADHDK